MSDETKMEENWGIFLEMLKQKFEMKHDRLRAREVPFIINYKEHSSIMGEKNTVRKGRRSNAYIVNLIYAAEFTKLQPEYLNMHITFLDDCKGTVGYPGNHITIEHTSGYKKHIYTTDTMENIIFELNSIITNLYDGELPNIDIKYFINILIEIMETVDLTFEDTKSKKTFNGKFKKQVNDIYCTFSKVIDILYRLQKQLDGDSFNNLLRMNTIRSIQRGHPNAVRRNIEARAAAPPAAAAARAAGAPQPGASSYWPTAESPTAALPTAESPTAASPTAASPTSTRKAELESRANKAAYNAAIAIKVLPDANEAEMLRAAMQAAINVGVDEETAGKIADEVLYRIEWEDSPGGGGYYEKYLKYKQKYLALKAQLRR